MSSSGDQNQSELRGSKRPPLIAIDPRTPCCNDGWQILVTRTNKYSGKVGQSESLRRSVLKYIPADDAAKEFDDERRSGCPRWEKTTSYLETAVNCVVWFDPANKSPEGTQGHKVRSGQGRLCRRYQSNWDQTRPTFINFMMATKVTFIMPLLFPLKLFHSLMKCVFPLRDSEYQFNRWKELSHWPSWCVKETPLQMAHSILATILHY